ncbi:MAG: hypothetical protein QE263_09360 [Vampirovibrionales bacterium]|nr:hypothetical protein [Vampirovibrionales bacterium]
MWNNQYANSYRGYNVAQPQSYQLPVSYARPQYSPQPTIYNNNNFFGVQPQILMQLLFSMLAGRNNYQAPSSYAQQQYPSTPCQPESPYQPYPQEYYPQPPVYNCPPKDGLNGYDGKDGINGKDGKNGYDGKDGINGKDGKNGYDGKDGKDGINGKDGKDGVCCDKDEQICVGIYGDPTVKINPINGQHFASTLTNGFDSKMQAGKTYTLLSDTATNGKKFEIKNVMGDINGAANAGGVATSASIIKNGDYTIEISSGDKPKAVVKDVANAVIKTIELSEAITSFELPDKSGVLKLVDDLQDGVDPAVKTKGFKFESKMVGTEYEAAYIPRTIDLKDGKDGKGYLLESTFCEVKADSAKGAKGYKFELPVGGVNVKLSVADMMNSTQTSGVAEFVKFLESGDDSFVA